jgi:predicted dehydrogenase
MSQIRLGLLGAGFLHDFYMQALREIPAVEVVAVATQTESSAKRFASKWGLPRAEWGEQAIEKLCCSPNIDAISVALPNDLHLPAVKLAAENGKHVICEKPLGRNLAEAKDILHTAEKAGILHGYAENQAFFPLHLHAFETIKSGRLGDVYLVRSREAHFGPHSPWFWDPARSGGGVALDMGCHSVEVARKCFQNDIPIEVTMWADTLVHTAKTKAEDNCTILVKFKHGQLGQAENSWSAHGGLDLRTEIYAKEGALFMDNTRETGMKMFANLEQQYVVEKAESTKGWLYPCPNEYQVYGYYNELKHFIECMQAGTMPSENFKDGVVVNAILDAGYRSVKEKRWVSVDL